ncbi:Barstar (barnase inhibitor) [Amycolatopsis pretoriensis]|uniref:Barstar (Barnase inhibitor) n=1 Tax=Amycolatopsis pretoriensis TaxID=218821 RepID=A0A1H5QGT8_9PSEU|nr:barstar family protein [Amycolatopsis pretoriensis]SEF24598.1 Barstar (barnase inhibitor) [Amycolatopsis pretoriensis]
MLVEAEELEGFFASPGDDAPEVVFRRAKLSEERPRQVEDAVLEIVNARRDKVGEYLVGRVIFGDFDPKRVTFRFFGDRCEFPEAATIWRRWASGPPLRAGEWLRLPVRHHPAWLHVVQNSWFATGHGSGGCADAEVMTLNGASVVTKAGFYCALGEAARGPGGYFGSNLDALVDCLRSGPAGKRPATLLWNDFFSSEEALGAEFLDAVTAVLDEFGVIVEAR